MSRTYQKIQKCDEISSAFLDLHKQDGFTLLPPSSMLHDTVPHSFIMSAGLVQVENDLEQVIGTTGGKFAFTQPCFRHFDMKQVGQDTTHLSLFQMSAAFHIGCSKRETILPRLWHFLTKILKLDTDYLWVTYLDDPQLGRDEPTYQCWRNLGVSETRLLGLDRHHCFWRQRSLGQIASDGKKCGPHTEIFYERPEHSCSACNEHQTPPVHCDCGRMVEISNSLFIENYIDKKGGLIFAETVFAECVIGIERISMVTQDTVDVYHIHKFQGWCKTLKSFFPQNLTDEQTNSVNLILDHLSAFVKLENEGAPPPGRGGRAYIMKKLARGIFTQLLLNDLPVERILSTMLVKSQHKASLRMLLVELARFSKTLERGKRELRKQIQQNATPQSAYQITLKKKLGVPKVLLKKIYNQAIQSNHWNFGNSYTSLEDKSSLFRAAQGE